MGAGVGSAPRQPGGGRSVADLGGPGMTAAGPVPGTMTNAIKAVRARAAGLEGLMRAEKQAGGEPARWDGPIRVAGSGQAYPRATPGVR
jgi:hypothetical protein